jgi:hypothetical protein
LPVEKLVNGAAHFVQAHVALDIALKDAPGFRRRLKTFHAHAGQRIRNFSFTLCAGLTKGCCRHLDNLSKLFYSIN